MGRKQLPKLVKSRQVLNLHEIANEADAILVDRRLKEIRICYTWNVEI